MKVLVTGGAGYIGTELISALIAKPEVDQVIVYDNLSRPNYNMFLGLRLQKHMPMRTRTNRLTTGARPNLYMR
jgi:UDP-glucose 4-epimerase